MKRARLRQLGLSIGMIPLGPNNAITDVAGPRVGYAPPGTSAGPTGRARVKF